MSRHLIRLRPRSDSFYLSKNRTVLATDLHGMVGSFDESGLFVYQTRMLSSYRYFINGQPPRPLALSNVHQNTWMGYYIVAPPGLDPDSRPDFGPGRLIAAQSIEFRVSRFIGDGMHEDIDAAEFLADGRRHALNAVVAVLGIALIAFSFFIDVVHSVKGDVAGQA